MYPRGTHITVTQEINAQKEDLANNVTTHAQSCKVVNKYTANLTTGKRKL